MIFQRLLDFFMGARNWVVIDDDSDDGDAIYAIPAGRLVSSDKVLRRDLRVGEATRVADELRKESAQ